MAVSGVRTAKRLSVDELLQAGVQAVAALGIDHVNVTDVTAIAQVSRPTFYTYFGDMNGFFAEVWIRFGRDWLDDQYRGLEPANPLLDQAMLELFAAARRIPELIEVVQPDFEAWWANVVGTDTAKQLTASWILAARLGLRITRPVSAKGEFGLPILPFLEITQAEIDSPLMAGLGVLPAKLPALHPITIEDDSVEGVLTMAAIDVVAKSGVAAASMTRIARRARVSTGSVYPRFKNASTLIESSFAAAIQSIVSRNVEQAVASGDGIDEYGLAVNAGFAAHRDVWRNYRVELHLAAAHDVRLAKLMEPGFQLTAKFLEESTMQVGVPRELAGRLAWFMHIHAIGISLIHSVLPSVALLDNRIMARHLAQALRS